MTAPHRRTDQPGWKAALLAIGLGLVAALLGAAPASAAESAHPNLVGSYAYDTVACSYEAAVLLSSPDTVATDARGAPGAPGAVSWVTHDFVGGCCCAANSGARSSNVVDDVMAETLGARQRNITSSYRLTADEALTAGQRWVGRGYAELGKPGSGVFRSVDGTRQFRMDANSLMGNHPPRVPHVHLEIYAPGARVPSVNDHIRLVD